MVQDDGVQLASNVGAIAAAHIAVAAAATAVQKQELDWLHSCKTNHPAILATKQFLIDKKTIFQI